MAAQKNEDGIAVHQRAEYMPSLPAGPFVRLDNGNILSVEGAPAQGYLSDDEGVTWKTLPLFSADSRFNLTQTRPGSLTGAVRFR